LVGGRFERIYGLYGLSAKCPVPPWLVWQPT